MTATAADTNLSRRMQANAMDDPLGLDTPTPDAADEEREALDEVDPIMAMISATNAALLKRYHDERQRRRGKSR